MQKKEYGGGIAMAQLQATTAEWWVVYFGAMAAQMIIMENIAPLWALAWWAMPTALLHILQFVKCQVLYSLRKQECQSQPQLHICKLFNFDVLIVCNEV